MTKTTAVQMPPLQVVAYRSLQPSGSYTYCHTPHFFYNAEPICTFADAQAYAESLRSEIADLKKRGYFHPENHSKTLQQIFADLHLFEEVSEHYAKCGISPESLRDWIVDKNTEAVVLTAKLEAARAALQHIADADIAVLRAELSALAAAQAAPASIDGEVTDADLQLLGEIADQLETDDHFFKSAELRRLKKRIAASQAVQPSGGPAMTTSSKQEGV